MIFFCAFSGKEDINSLAISINATLIFCLFIGFYCNNAKVTVCLQICKHGCLFPVAGKYLCRMFAVSWKNCNFGRHNHDNLIRFSK